MGKLVSKTLGAVGLGPAKAKAKLGDRSLYDISKEVKPAQQATSALLAQSQANQAITGAGRQNVLAQMSEAAQGRGPSLAEIQMKAAQEKNLASQLSGLQSARGGSAAANQRALIQNTGAANRDIGQQAVAARLQERDAFLNQAAQVGQEVRGDVGQQLNYATANKRSLQGLDVANTAAINQARQANAAADNAMAGALIGGAGAVLGGGAGGFGAKLGSKIFGAAEGGKITPEGVQKSEQIDEIKIDQFLNTIKQIESGGGKNFSHEELKSGIHKGHSAIGNYGLMPNTVDEIISNMGESAGPELLQIKKMSAAEKKSYLEANPETESKLAKQLAAKVLTNQKGDERKAGYSWFQGSNLSAKKVDEKKYNEHDYVKKFDKFRAQEKQALSAPAQIPANKLPIAPAIRQPQGITTTPKLGDPNRYLPQTFRDGGLAERGGRSNQEDEQGRLLTDKQKAEKAMQPVQQSTYKPSDSDSRSEDQKRAAEEYERTGMLPKWQKKAEGGMANYQEGGDVDGPGTPTSDSIPAMLSDGEFVIKASVVQHPSVEAFLHKLNKGSISPQDLEGILNRRAKQKR